MKRSSAIDESGEGSSKKRNTSSHPSVGELATQASIPLSSTQESSNPLVDGSAEEVEEVGDPKEKKKLSDEEYLALIESRSRSNIWVHYKRKMKNGLVKGNCKYCHKEYCCGTTGNGTSSLKKHILKCMKYQPNIEETRKRGKLFFSKSTSNGKELALGGLPTPERMTRLCARLIILDEHPFSIVEGIGFRQMHEEAYPHWKIPKRKKMAKECLNIYLEEKKKLKDALKGRRVCLTTDIWTSKQNISYMVVTGHWVDEIFELHKVVLNFFNILDHTGDTIATKLEDCMSEWGIEKILTITVDNASANDVAMREIRRRLLGYGNPNSLLNDGNNMQMRCVAHILNLLVNDGLKTMQDSIENIREAVRFVRKSDKRKELLKKHAERVKIESKGFVILDLPTRWNSTFLMLTSALKFQKAFDRMGEEDRKIKCLMPSREDWKNAETFATFLQPFYEVTLRVCCSNTPTIHNTFGDLLKLYNLLQEYKTHPQLLSITPPMEDKYKKYWGEFAQMNDYIFVGLVLDPRHKIPKLEDYLELVFESESVDAYELESKVHEVVERVKKFMERLYSDYEKEFGGNGSHGEMDSYVQIDDLSLPKMTKFETKLKEKELKRRKDANMINNDVDRYVKDPIECDEGDFNLLSWWKKIGAPKYPILARIARDVLAVPVSTISSESCFSTSGRIISPHRCSLSPRSVQALICTQSWLRGEIETLELDLSIEEVEFCEEVEKGTYL